MISDLSPELEHIMWEALAQMLMYLFSFAGIVFAMAIACAAFLFVVSQIIGIIAGKNDWDK